MVKALIVLGSSVAALSVAAPAYASAPLTGAGTGIFQASTITNAQTVGSNIVQTRELAGSVSGTLEGSFSEQVTGVIHPSGKVTFTGVMTFTGTVTGCGSATLTIDLNGQGEVATPTTPTVTQASIRVIHQPGGTGVTGVGKVSQVGGLFTYQVRYKC